MLKKTILVFICGMIGFVLIILVNHFYLPSRFLFYDELSMLTGLCIRDGTCESRSYCVSGGDGSGSEGCRLGGYTSGHWKDPVLKSRYQEKVSTEKAKKCASDFLNKYRDQFNLYEKKNLDAPLFVSGPEKFEIQDQEYYVGPFDQRDTYTFRVYNSSLEIEVGSQTCNVYPYKSQFIQ